MNLREWADKFFSDRGPVPVWELPSAAFPFVHNVPLNRDRLGKAEYVAAARKIDSDAFATAKAWDCKCASTTIRDEADRIVGRRIGFSCDLALVPFTYVASTYPFDR